MLARLLLLVLLAPLVVAAIILGGAWLALQLAFGPVADAVAGCTQWDGRA